MKCATSLMQRVTVGQGPARSGKWPECGCCRAAAGCCGPGCVQPGSDRPEPAGSGPRGPVRAEGSCCSLARAPVGGGH